MPYSPPQDATTIDNTKLTNGGSVETFNESGQLHAQFLDASGNPVGSQISFPAEGNGAYSGFYEPAVMANGGFAVLRGFSASGGTSGVVSVVDASGAMTADFSVGGASGFTLTTASDGGIAISASLLATDPRSPGETLEPLVRFFDASGNATANGGTNGWLMLAGKIQSVDSDNNGHVLVHWRDGSTINTMTVDPLHPNISTPATPTVTILDDAGPQTGAVSNGGSTDDTTPTVRVEVHQTGELFVQFGHDSDFEFQTGGIQVVASDVARGYVDVPVNAPVSDQPYWALVRVTDTTGSSSETQRISFEVTASTSPPSGDQTLQAHDGGSTLVGGSGDDTLIGAHGPDQMTGGAGADHFQFNEVPWQGAQITDFTPGTDLLDLSALLQHAGYSGSDPVGAGYVKFLDDGHGDTWLYFDPTPSSDPWGDYVATLQGVAPSQLSDASLVSAGASPPPPSPPPVSPPPVSPPPASGGQTLQAHDGGSTLVGGSGDDTLIGAHGPDQMTGGAGADQFTFNEVPWQAAMVTDFTPGTDHIDLRSLLQQAGYAGSDPVGDGYVKFLDNGHGDTWLYFDPTPSSDPWGDYIATLQGVAPSSLSDASLTGFGATASPPPPPASPPPPPASGGQTLQAQDGGSTLVGGAGDDTLIGAHGPDQMTGNGGSDHFVFNEVPWQGATITDFTPGTDKIDLTGLFNQYGYEGMDPVKEGWVKFLDDGHGDTWLYFDPTPQTDPWGDYIATIKGVAPSQLSVHDII